MKQAVLNDGSNGMHFKAGEELRNVPGKMWQDVGMFFFLLLLPRLYLAAVTGLHVPIKQHVS